MTSKWHVITTRSIDLCFKIIEKESLSLSLSHQLKNGDYFSQFVTEDFEHYINRKRSDRCYGNYLEMQAIAEMYNRSIEVFQYSMGKSKT